MKHVLGQIVALGLAVIAWAAQESAQSPPKLFSINFRNTTAFQGLVDFSAHNRIPVGLVLTDQPTLCVPQKQLSLKNVTAAMIFDALLLDTGYVWSLEDGVYVIKPKTVITPINRVLQLKDPRFGSMETTMHGLGVILQGHIQSSLEPDQGFAASILSSSKSTVVQPFVLENRTVEQIANYVVSLDQRGIWILTAVGQGTKQGTRTHLEIYGYNDDAQVLMSLPCSP